MAATVLMISLILISKKAYGQAKSEIYVDDLQLFPNSLRVKTTDKMDECAAT